MEKVDLKYLLAYLAPLFCWAGLYYGGWLSPGMFYLAFVIIPIIEILFPSSNEIRQQTEEVRKSDRLFTLLLYTHLPIIYGLLAYFFIKTYQGGFSNWELAGQILNMGIILGAMGINIGHELGHRNNLWSKNLSLLLLLPSHYMHFQIEHNLGHHKHVATPEDPSTARLGESLYRFWVRSVLGVYKGAWKIEKEILERKNQSFFSLSNRMIQYTFIQLLYYGLILWIFNWQVLVIAILTGCIGFLLLETVNYIEHYGLVREKLPSGRYEAVNISHSWNSNHPLGRIFLFELTRHADHHYQSQRPYQILKHYEKSPQLPMGYPTSMLMSLIPPLWMSKIDPIVPKKDAY